MTGLDEFEGFDWDSGNRSKNWRNHRVSDSECEQVFFNEPLILLEDEEHSDHEQRYYALGHTDAGRQLAVILTQRGGKIRIISARDMTRREREYYLT